MKALYTTIAKTHGGRNGRVETTDGLLKLHLAMPIELGGKGGATNPEQLFAVGYAACFESAIRHVANVQKNFFRGCFHGVGGLFICYSREGF